MHLLLLIVMMSICKVSSITLYRRYSSQLYVATTTVLTKRLSTSTAASNIPLCNETTDTLINAYKTLNISSICDATCVIVQAPTPDQYTFQLCDLLASHSPYCHILQEEIEFGMVKEQHSQARLNKYIGGRVALRRALDMLRQHNVPPILRNQWGAPILPASISGSISHKDYVIVALAAVSTTHRLGVDIEYCGNKAAGLLQRRILSDCERKSIGSLPNISSEEDVLLRFSFKESIYKAIHSFVLRSVDFNEVEVYPLADGTADIKFCLKTNEQFTYKARWIRYCEKYWLTCVSVSKSSS